MDIPEFVRTPSSGGDWVSLTTGCGGSPRTKETAMFPAVPEDVTPLRDAPNLEPFTRMYATATAVGNSIYYIGGTPEGFGLTLNTDGPQVWKLSTASMAVEAVELSPNELPQTLVQHTAVASGEKIYVIGNSWSREGTIFVIDTVGKTAMRVFPELLSSIPANLHCHTSALFPTPSGSVILTFGGSQFHRTLSELYEYNIEHNTWRRISVRSSARPPARLYHAGCNVRDQYFYVFGGAPDAKTTTTGDPVFNDLWRFDLTSSTWELIESDSADRPSPRGSTSLIYHEPYIYLFGGFNGGKELNDFYRFDVDHNIWVELEPYRGSDGGRWAYAVCHVENRIYYIGGFVIHSETDTSPTALCGDVICFVPEEMTLKHVLGRFIARNNMLTPHPSSSFCGLTPTVSGD